MTVCPYYSQTLNGEEANRDNIIWHEGYRAAHEELELVKQKLDETARELDQLVRETREKIAEIKKHAENHG